MAEPDEYSPDAISYWLSGRCSRGCRWSMLESAVEGGTGASGMGSGRGERLGLAHLKADLEHAADQLPLYWQATRVIFSKQHRYSVWLNRWHMADNPTTGPDQEPLELPAAVDLAIWKMAKTLGWSAVADQAA